MSSYNNYTMDELVGLLSSETDMVRFVKVSKVFIQKFVDSDYIPRTDWESKIEDIQTASYQEGYTEGYAAGNEDAVD